MSVLRYAGLEFSDWLTHTFEQKAIYDSSNTDLTCYQIRIAGQCYLSQPLKPTLSGAGVSPARNMSAIRLHNQFMQCRKARTSADDADGLSFKVAGQEMIPFSSTGLDSKNGPLPMRFTAIQIAEAAFLCDLEVISHWAETSSLSEGGNILSHRWREDVDIDLNFYSKKTRTGKIIVSSSAFNSAKAQTDSLRETLVTTGIEPGFVRESSHYGLSENGLELGYVIVDQERFRLPPAPATDADGEVTITTQRLGSPGRFATGHVRLTGPKKQGADPARLIRVAIGALYADLRRRGGVFPIKVDLRENKYRNEISAAMYCRINPRRGENFGDLLMSLRGFGEPLAGSEPGTKSPDPGTRGTANLLLHAAAFHDPTLGQALDRKTNSLQIQNGQPPVGMIPGG